MKRIKIIITLIVLAMIGFIGQSVAAAGFFAADESGDVRIEASKIIDSSTYVAGNRVVIDGTIKGDLFCAGNEVVITGVVEGDVICAGANVVVGGQVAGDVRVAGNNVTIRANIEGSATVAGSSVVVEKDAVIGRDLAGGASNVSVDGVIGRDMLLGASIATIGGVVNRDVDASIGTFSFRDGAKIHGKLSYQSDTESTVPQGVVDEGVVFTKQAASTSSPANVLLIVSLGFVGVFVVLCLIVTMILPKYVHESASIDGRRVLIAFLAGFTGIVLLPLLSFLLMASTVGLLAGLVILVAWLLVMMLSGVMAAYYIGGLLLRKRAKNALVVVLIGAVVLAGACLIPLLNILVVIGAVCIGSGMQILRLGQQFSKHPYSIT